MRLLLFLSFFSFSAMALEVTGGNVVGTLDTMEEVECKDNVGNAFGIECSDGIYLNRSGLLEFMVRQSIETGEDPKIPKATYKGAGWKCYRLAPTQIVCRALKSGEPENKAYTLYEKVPSVKDSELAKPDNTKVRKPTVNTKVISK